jgi:hypothetical protein
MKAWDCSVSVLITESLRLDSVVAFTITSGCCIVRICMRDVYVGRSILYVVIVFVVDPCVFLRVTCLI